MCDLEGEAKPVLESMITGVPSTLIPSDQLIVAQWAVKTAMVAESMMEFDATFSREDCELVRTQARPPLRPRVLMAAYEGEGLVTSYMRSVGDLLSDGDPFMDLYVHTVQIGCLILQVRGTRTFPATDNISLNQIAKPQFFEISVFPPVEVCRWPPRRILNKDSLREYSAAGQTPIVGPPGAYSAPPVA